MIGLALNTSTEARNPSHTRTASAMAGAPTSYALGGPKRPNSGLAMRAENALGGAETEIEDGGFRVTVH